MKNRTKEQFNVWMKPSQKEFVLAVSDRLQWTRNEITEVAMATLFGANDGLTREKRKLIVKAAQEIGIPCPFDMPLASFENSVIRA